MTAIRSRANYDRFRREYQSCVVDQFTKVYAVGRKFSKVSAGQFALFMKRIGAPLRAAPQGIRGLFDARLTEDVWIAEECAFDWTRLRDIVARDIEATGIPIHFGAPATGLERTSRGHWAVTAAGGKVFEGAWVFNCTYAMLNALRVAAGLPVIPLKHELTEMSLVDLPDALAGISVTMMCGPFFSFMPYPARKASTLSHVRYTPHLHWHDKPGEPWTSPYERFLKLPKESAYAHMVADAARYVPALRDCRQVDSIWEVKTVLPQSEADDGRPILFHHAPDAPGLLSIMGGKIDNIFDVEHELKQLLT
jgi:glycine/D-amino acid oxidase-like deaminating enzyme